MLKLQEHVYKAMTYIPKSENIEHKQNESSL